MTKKAKKIADDAFDLIAEETIQKAEAVDCEFGVFVSGLLTIEIAIRERRHLAEAELDKKDHL